MHDLRKICPQLVLIGIFCVLSAFRDVFAEMLFKGASNIHPAFILFVDSAITQLIAFCVAGPSKLFSLSSYGPRSNILALMFTMAFFTFTAFLTYYLAIATPLGAPMTSLIAFGMDPIITAIFAAIVFREKLDGNYWVAATGCCVGLLILNYPTLSGIKVAPGWWLGLLFAVTNNFLFAGYVITIKKLTNKKIPSTILVFHRLTMTTLGCGVFLLLNPELFSLHGLTVTALHGLLTFAAPLMAFVYLVSKYPIRKLIVLMFLIPVLTAFVGSALGVNQLNIYDWVACAVVLGSVVRYELKISSAKAA